MTYINLKIIELYTSSKKSIIFAIQLELCAKLNRFVTRKSQVIFKNHKLKKSVNQLKLKRFEDII